MSCTKEEIIVCQPQQLKLSKLKTKQNETKKKKKTLETTNKSVKRSNHLGKQFRNIY